jgi:hypothetical protein
MNIKLQMSETRILIRLLRMYFPRYWEFGSALSKPRYATTFIQTFQMCVTGVGITAVVAYIRVEEERHTWLVLFGKG